MDLIKLYREYEKVSSEYNDKLSVDHKHQLRYLMTTIKVLICKEEMKLYKTKSHLKLVS